MRVMIDDLEVLWPYDYIYPEQYSYMLKLYQALQSGHCLLEMPTGTGKTVSLLSLILSYQYHKQAGKGKLVYCTRTVQEMDKVVEELRRVMEFRERTILEGVKLVVQQQREQQQQQGEDERKDSAVHVDMTGDGAAAAAGALPLSVRDPRILGVCLSSRRNLCIHSEVSSFDNRNKVDALCRNLTASFIREQHAQGAAVPICEYYEGFMRDGQEVSLLGVYSLADLKVLGAERGWCPYFWARHAIQVANVVVYNYQYMLDPKISGLVSREMEKGQPAAEPLNTATSQLGAPEALLSSAQLSCCRSPSPRASLSCS